MDAMDKRGLHPRFADRFWSVEWPGQARPSIFYDSRALDPEAPGGVLHAKAVVADDESVFVTSANLTEAALERNIELELLLRDRALSACLAGYSVASSAATMNRRSVTRKAPAMPHCSAALWVPCGFTSW